MGNSKSKKMKITSVSEVKAEIHNEDHIGALKNEIEAPTVTIEDNGVVKRELAAESAVGSSGGDNDNLSSSASTVEVLDYK